MLILKTTKAKISFDCDWEINISFSLNFEAKTTSPASYSSDEIPAKKLIQNLFGGTEILL